MIVSLKLPTNGRVHVGYFAREARQTTLVASPRNHLYRTSRSLIQGGFFATGSAMSEFDHAGDIADQFNLRHCVVGEWMTSRSTSFLRMPRASSWIAGS